MAELLPISNVSLDDLYRLIEEAQRLDAASGAERVRDFLASVDWSTRHERDPEIARTLGELEGLTTDLDEGVLDASQYRDALAALVPSRR
jgi:hypothetical protein